MPRRNHTDSRIPSLTDLYSVRYPKGSIISPILPIIRMSPNDLGRDNVGLRDEGGEHGQRIEIANDLHPLPYVRRGISGGDVCRSRPQFSYAPQSVARPHDLLTPSSSPFFGVSDFSFTVGLSGCDRGLVAP
jgi:hypothetical protein